MTNSLLIFLCLWVSFNLCAQFSIDFSTDQSFKEIGFEGDTSHFLIEDGALHLRSPQAGNSLLFIKTNIPDSVEYTIDFKLDFSPSSNNKLRIYLQLDTFDIDLASGYYIEIGENGAEDKIRFVRMIEGEALTIAEGNPGEFALDPVDSSVKILRDHSGLWEISVKHKDGSSFYKPDLELFDSTLKRYFDQYFALECIYTSTRTDKFHFSELHLREVVKDTLPPVCSYFELLDDHTLALYFDEILEKQAAIDPSNYSLKLQQISPSEVHFNDFKPNKVLLGFDTQFDNSSVYTLQMNGLKDLQGNVLKDASIDFYYPATPDAPKELIINELLFNPFEDQADFLEVYNCSGNILDLYDIVISNQTRPDSDVKIDDHLIMFPADYLLICEDTAKLGNYVLPDSLLYLPLKLPAFNNDEGNVTLRSGHVTIDSFDYNEDMHFPLIDDPEGISLERLSPKGDTDEITNWHSASDLSGGATPGYKNSQFISDNTNNASYFKLKESLFSPDNDGFQDQLVIQYDLPSEGFVGTVIIFDLPGNFIQTVVNNKLLGKAGLFSWNGLGKDGKSLQMGPYIVVCQAFHSSGKILGRKLVAYLTGDR
jgi:hypothetical protein